MKDILQQTFLGNSIERFCWFGVILLTGILFKRIASRIFSYAIFGFIKKYAAGLGAQRLFILIKKPIETFVLLIALYFAFNRLNFPVEWQLGPREHFGVRMFIHHSFIVALSFACTWVILRLVDFFGLILAHKASLRESATGNQLVPFLRQAIKVVIVIFSIFFVLGTVFGLNITSLIAGLGIGGLAVALAAKESIENLLGSFTIFFDKPFVIGETIKTGSIEGTVEEIGFRSTRIRTAEKSYITVPNKKLIDNELDNLSRRTERRVLSTINLSYTTSLEKINRIIEEIKKELDEHKALNHSENRVTLYELSPASVNIQVLYFVNSNNATLYFQTRQDINSKIITIVNKNEGVFAIPD